MTPKPILISGGGLASLLLARSLLRYKIPFHIFERDASMSSRGQGYRLRLSSEGLDAIESVLDPAAWTRFYESCGKTGGGGMQVLDAMTGEQLEQPGGGGSDGGRGKENGGTTENGGATENGGGKENSGSTEHSDDREKSGAKKSGGVNNSLGSRDGKIVGIARGEMRNLFMEGCEDFLHFNKHVKGYELAPDGVRAVFADGTKSVEGSLLVGGEGINSYVAKQLSGGALKVYDTGARGVHGQAPARAFSRLGEGVFRIVDSSRPGKTLSVITNVRPHDAAADADVQFGWTMIGQPGLIAAPDDDYTVVGKRASDIARSLTSAWHARFRPLFDESVEREGAFWKITCSAPSGVPAWPNEPRVTVIGDAVHSMTPAGGLGANTAVRDAALLGALLRDAGGFDDGVTARYEEEMRVYGSEAVAQSYGSATKMMGVHIDEQVSETLEGEIRDNRSYVSTSSI